MSEAYKELLIKHKKSSKDQALGVTILVLCFLSFVAVFFFGPLVLLATIALGIASYFTYFSRMNVEYEYLYMDKQLNIDRINNETNRKNVQIYQLEEMEILAPADSYRLDNYRKRECSEKDYSTGTEEAPEGLRHYVMYLSGNQKVKLTLSEEFANSIRMHLPQKVFLS